MKLGGKKTRQSELLDALGGEALLSEDMSVPSSPAVGTNPEPVPIATSQKDERGSLPIVTPERCVSYRFAYKYQRSDAYADSFYLF